MYQIEKRKVIHVVTTGKRGSLNIILRNYVVQGAQIWKLSVWTERQSQPSHSWQFHLTLPIIVPVFKVSEFGTRITSEFETSSSVAVVNLGNRKRWESINNSHKFKKKTLYLNKLQPINSCNNACNFVYHKLVQSFKSATFLSEGKCQLTRLN